LGGLVLAGHRRGARRHAPVGAQEAPCPARAEEVDRVFERCDPATKLVVDAALEEARARGHSWLGTEHLLLALARRHDLLPADAAALVPDADAVATALSAEIGPGRAKAELLKVLGVDLDEVRSA